MLIAGPRHLRAVLDEYVAHYNRHRPHRARNPRPPDHDDSITAPVADLAARIRRHKVLGGLIHEYAQVANGDMVFGTHRAAHAAPRRATVPSVTFSGHGRYRLGRSRGLR